MLLPSDGQVIWADAKGRWGVESGGADGRSSSSKSPKSSEEPHWSDRAVTTRHEEDSAETEGRNNSET